MIGETDHQTGESGDTLFVSDQPARSVKPAALPMGVHSPDELNRNAARQTGRTVGRTAAQKWERIGLGLAAAAVVLGLVLTGARRLGASPYVDEPVPARRMADVRIDLNTAAWYDLLLLDGVGETLARRIVADRDERGPLKTVDDLERVPGIGRRKLATIRDQVSVSGAIVTLNGPMPPPSLTAE